MIHASDTWNKKRTHRTWKKRTHRTWKKQTHRTRTSSTSFRFSCEHDPSQDLVASLPKTRPFSSFRFALDRPGGARCSGPHHPAHERLHHTACPLLNFSSAGGSRKRALCGVVARAFRPEELLFATLKSWARAVAGRRPFLPMARASREVATILLTTGMARAAPHISILLLPPPFSRHQISLSSAPPTRFAACCKHMIPVFRMFQTNVAILHLDVSKITTILWCCICFTLIF
jgi:hypothetical protein